MENSGSDGSSENESTPHFDYSKDLEEEEYGLADPFLQFETQAEKRTLELLRATDERLFQVAEDDSELLIEEQEEGEGNYPAYIYMSDQFRLKKPPQFQHWQQNFQYLQVTGSRLLDGECNEHLQMLPTELKYDSGGVNNKVRETLLKVEGRMCLQDPTRELNRVYEEIILCDGEMEKTLAYHADSDTEMKEEVEDGKLSSNSVYVEEVLDVLTMECFSTIVAPVLTSIYRAMRGKHQYVVRKAREGREEAANHTVNEQIELRTTQQQQEAQEEVASVKFLRRQRQKEECKETECRDLLLKQQVEENDEEEVKIKTLAYSHTREWYQPKKKCFSHRGRQLTYLKPVLQVKDADEVLMPHIQEHSVPITVHKHRRRQRNVLKKSKSLQPEWVTGGALTKDKLCDISWVKKIARPPINPPPSPLYKGSRRHMKEGNQKEKATSSGGVQLPMIASPEQSVKVKAISSATRKESANFIPTQIKTISPYQVPAEANHNKDRQHSANVAH